MNIEESTYQKCGEIFLANEKTYTFLCVHCDELFYEFNDFKEHSLQHLSSFGLEFDEGPIATNSTLEGVQINFENNISDKEDETNVDCKEMQEEVLDENNDTVENIEIKTENLDVEENDINEETPILVVDDSKNSKEMTNGHNACPHCGKHFKFKSHDSKRCSKIMEMIKKYEGDFLKLLRKGILCCCSCQQYFTNYKELYDHHTDAKHCQQTKKCKICKFYNFMNSKIANQNRKSLKDGKEEPFQRSCKKCSINFSSKSHSDSHFRTLHRDESIDDDMSDKEDECKEIFTNTVNGGVRRMFKCLLCERVCKKKGQITTHMRTHTNDRPYKCNMCSAAFTVSANLRCHIVYKHTEDRPYSCDFEGCNSKFKLLNLKKQHEKRHQPANFQCEICGNYYKTKFNLLKHQQSRHTDAATWTHQCEVCQKKFAQKQHLTEHSRIHTGEKPFGCDLCDKFFRKRNALREHKKLHSDERQYVCRFCGKGFKQAAGYWGHMKRHPMIS